MSSKKAHIRLSPTAAATTLLSTMSVEHHATPELRHQSSNLAVSFLTGTDSTTSDNYGPGRIVGRLLVSSGRRLERFINRTAAKMGFGPNAIVHRVLCLLHERHARMHDSSSSPKDARRSGPASQEYVALLNQIVDLASVPCDRCHRPRLLHQSASIRDCKGYLIKLIALTQCGILLTLDTTGSLI